MGPRADWSPWSARPSGAGLLCDYDGTLAPIAEERDKAVPLPGARRVLAELAGRLALVGVVSGRPLRYLLANLGAVPGLGLFGLYGLERSAGGVVDEEARAWEHAVAAAAADAEREAPAGVEVERKGLSFALHARRHPERAAWALEWAGRAASEKGLVLQPGRLSVELLAPVVPGKGSVVEELSEDLDAICFVGDDAGDLPAFAALRRLRSAGKDTLAVGVASAEQPPELAGAVDLVVDGPTGALALLEELASGLRSSHGR